MRVSTLEVRSSRAFSFADISFSHQSRCSISSRGIKNDEREANFQFSKFHEWGSPLRLEHAKTQLLGLNDSCTHPATHHGTSLDSFSKVVMRLFNIVRTLAMGSALLLNLVAIENSTRLLNFTAWLCKYSAARRAG